MALSDPYYVFRGLSGLGFVGLWLFMMLNGTFVEMLATNWRGVFPTGTALKTSWTGFYPIDFFLGILIVFFSSVISIDDLPDIGPFLISVDLVLAIVVFNQMTLVESERNRKTGSFRSAAWWQTMWNLFGAACAMPVFLHLYVSKRLLSSTRVSRIPAERAQALPFSSIWNILISVPLLVPTVLRMTPTQIQAGMVIWLLGPPSLSIFQSVICNSITSAKTYSGVKSPTILSYWIVGGVSAIVHLATVAAAIMRPDSSLSRVYWPNHSAVVPGPSYLVEGAMLFIQYDYMVITLSMFAVAFYMAKSGGVSAGQNSHKAEASPPYLTTGLVVMTVLFGPGASMAWILGNREAEMEVNDVDGKL